MTTHTVESLEARVMAFMTLELPGQPPMMHMGTSYLVQDLMAEVRRLSAQPAAEPASPRLTDEQIEEIFQEAAGADEGTALRFARAIEAAHGIGKETP